MAAKDLTVPEHRVRCAILHGATADFCVGQPTEDDPSLGAAWGADRSVRAEILSELVMAARTGDSGRSPALRVRGARVIGTLDLETASLSCMLLLRDCFFDQVIHLAEARAPTMRMTGCHVVGLDASRFETQGDLQLDAGFTAREGICLVGAKIGGQLDLSGAVLGSGAGPALDADGMTVERGALFGSGFTSRGEVRLVGARLSGQVTFAGAKMSHEDGSALNADGVTVEQDLYLGDGFTARGEVRLVGARVKGQLVLDGAELVNPEANALDCDKLNAAIGVSCRGLDARGSIRLLGAHISGPLSFAGATLSNPGGRALQADGLAVEEDMFCHNDFAANGEVRLIGARIGGQLTFGEATLQNPGGVVLDLEGLQARVLLFRPRLPPVGRVDLTHARVDVFADRKASWPDMLDLRGFVYNALYESPSVDVAARLRWLELDRAGYSPQPYEQLAAVYRQAGREDDARRVGIRKQQRRRQDLNWPGKIGNSLLRCTVGYGYRTWFAGIWLLALTGVGWVMFGLTYPNHFLPSGNPANPRPTFHSAMYTLDLLLPVVNLRQQEFWIPQGWLSWCVVAFILMGWALTSAVVAALTGILRRD